MSKLDYDIIVVGSGASGVNAAWRPAHAGLRVLMLDVGNEDLSYRGLAPDAPFETLRRADERQHRYFLGDRMEGVPLRKQEAAAQLSPARGYVFKDAPLLAPTNALDFAAMQTFARGGLGQAWGAVSFPFLDRELLDCGLPVPTLREHYEAVAQRIGVSGVADDDLSALRGPLQSLQPPLALDQNARAVQSRYARRRAGLQQSGIALGQALLAALSQPLQQRRPVSQFDMDFFVDTGDSVYRPEITLRDLQKLPNFHYRRPFLAQRFVENDAGPVSIETLDLQTRLPQTFSARAILLAAGSLGTTRIALRSFDQYDVAVPFVCNPHCFIPSLRLAGLGTTSPARQHSLAQLTLIHTPPTHGADLVQAQMYSYRSLMSFRLLNDLPLPQRQSLRILRTLIPALTIWVVQHADRPSAGKHCRLRRATDGGIDRLEISYRLTSAESARNDAAERSIAASMRKLGCWPLKRVQAMHGSSIHYAGQLPTTEADRPLTTCVDGRLRGTRNVFVADGAAFAYLPAKGPTLTLMANADRIGKIVMDRLRNGAQD